MKSQTWSTISTPGRQILGPGRRFLVLVDDSSDPVNFSRRFQVQIDDSSDPIEKTTLWSSFSYYLFLFLFARARAGKIPTTHTHPYIAL